MLIGFLHFYAMWLLAGAFTRLFVLKFPNNPISTALLFAQ